MFFAFHLNKRLYLSCQGFCCYLEQSIGNLKERGVVIGYDARAHPPSGGSSKRFASLAAAVFISRGVPVHLFSDITPTPFVVRTLVFVVYTSQVRLSVVRVDGCDANSLKISTSLTPSSSLLHNTCMFQQVVLCSATPTFCSCNIVH